MANQLHDALWYRCGMRAPFYLVFLLACASKTIPVSEVLCEAPASCEEEKAPPSCPTSEGEFSAPLWGRCVPIIIQNRGWEYMLPGFEPTHCESALRFALVEPHEKETLALFSKEEKLFEVSMRDGASWRMAPDCQAAWLSDASQSALFTKKEGAWIKTFSDSVGQHVKASFSPDGKTLFLTTSTLGEGQTSLSVYSVSVETGQQKLLLAKNFTKRHEVLLAANNTDAFVQVSERDREAPLFYKLSLTGEVLEANGDRAHGSRVTLQASSGARPLLILTHEFDGTWVYDAKTLTQVGRWPELGRSGNAYTEGASPSLDGEYLAIPEPYMGRISFLRAKDLRIVAEVSGKLLLGAGRVVWSKDSIQVEAFPLPYE